MKNKRFVIEIDQHALDNTVVGLFEIEGDRIGVLDIFGSPNKFDLSMIAKYCLKPNEFSEEWLAKEVFGDLKSYLINNKGDKA